MRWLWFWICGLCLGGIIATSAMYDQWRGGVRFYCLDPRYHNDYLDARWEFSPASLLPQDWEDRLSLQALAEKIALQHSIDPLLFRALVTFESAWNPTAVSSKGAVGLTQVMPATGKAFCGLSRAQLLNPRDNLNCGASYFSHQLRRFGDVKKALCAYNAGPGIVSRLGRCPTYQETRRYTARILTTWKEWRKLNMR
jgi:soluble lytic murein transglycosylase-like protein